MLMHKLTAVESAEALAFEAEVHSETCVTAAMVVTQNDLMQAGP